MGGGTTKMATVFLSVSNPPPPPPRQKKRHTLNSSLPKFLDFTLFGETISVANKWSGIVGAYPLRGQIKYGAKPVSFCASQMWARFLLQARAPKGEMGQTSAHFIAHMLKTHSLTTQVRYPAARAPRFSAG